LVQAPTGNYLSFTALARLYTTVNEVNYTILIDPAWRLWIDALGLDEWPYYFFNDKDGNGRIKSDIEITWMREPAEKRRVVEKIAIQLRQNIAIDLHTLPLRERSSVLPHLSTPPFHQIDPSHSLQDYVDYGDAVLKRRTWLYGIGFPEACNYAPPQTPEQTAALDQLFSSRPVLERKAIVSKAKALNLLVNPPNPSWTALQACEVYPVGCFTSHQEYVEKRREWLGSLGLDHWPFSYASLVNRYNECAEVAWNEMTPDQRSTIWDQAMEVRNSKNPLFVSWNLVEEILGYSLQAHFDGDEAEYYAKRVSWLESIGISRASDAKEFLQLCWDTMPAKDKLDVLSKATIEKEKFCTEYAAKFSLTSTPAVENQNGNGAEYRSI
jgi:hypothetical protein